MIRGIVILFSITFLVFSSISAKEMGYFDIQNGSEYLGFSNMSKEFRINSLMNSAIANDSKATQIFIASGADVNQKNTAGVTPLHLASRNGAYETAQVLIESGARVNEKDKEGWTPLMRASLVGDKKIMKLLIENGAEIWSQNNDGETPLLHTAMADCYECGKLILSNTESDNFLIKNQSKQALQIVNKRYNEPFIELLKGNYDIGEELKIENKTDTTNNKKLKKDGFEDTIQNGNMTQLVYIFTGKVISNEKLEKIGKSSYDISVKNQNKLEKKKKEKAIILDLDSDTENKDIKIINKKQTPNNKIISTVVEKIEPKPEKAEQKIIYKPQIKTIDKNKKLKIEKKINNKDTTTKSKKVELKENLTIPVDISTKVKQPKIDNEKSTEKVLKLNSKKNLTKTDKIKPLENKDTKIINKKQTPNNKIIPTVTEKVEPKVEQKIIYKPQIKTIDKDKQLKIEKKINNKDTTTKSKKVELKENLTIPVDISTKVKQPKIDNEKSTEKVLKLNSKKNLTKTNNLENNKTKIIKNKNDIDKYKLNSIPTKKLEDNKVLKFNSTKPETNNKKVLKLKPEQSLKIQKPAESVKLKLTKTKEILNK